MGKPVSVTRVERWFIERRPSSRTGKWRGFLWFDNPGKTGEYKHTSAIAAVDLERRLVTTHSGSVYLLGTPRSGQGFPFPIDFELAGT